MVLETPVAKSAGPGAERLSLPDKPSIAVLPLDNMSGDPEQEYFSDGITEDIITELSRFGEVFVIARNSSFSYKGTSVKVQDAKRPEPSSPNTTSAGKCRVPRPCTLRRWTRKLRTRS